MSSSPLNITIILAQATPRDNQFHSLIMPYIKLFPSILNTS